MVTHTIEWHEAGHANHTKYLADQKKEVERAQERFDRSLKDWQFSEHQIACAKAAGRAEFDPDKYKKPKK